MSGKRSHQEVSMSRTLVALCLGLTLCSLLPCLTSCADVKTAPLYTTSFEEGAAGALPEGWTLFRAGATGVTLSTTQAHTGKTSLHVLDDSTTEAEGLRSPFIPVKPDTDYTIEWWSLCAPGRACSFYVEFWDADGKRIDPDGVSSLGCPDSGKWEYKRAVLPSPPTAVKATVLPYSHSGGTGDGYFDDITFKEGVVDAYDRTPQPPAKVKHPCGLYREADLARAKANIEKYPWAQAVLADFKRRAEFWMQLPEDQIAEWIPELTPIRVLNCPKCGANWDYAWRDLPPHQIKCTRCGLVLPSADYPEDGRETLINPLGKRVTYTFYQNDKGERFRISGRIRYQAIGKLDSLGAVGKYYALTGDRAYAEKAVKVLRRIAEVYPGYVAHDWNRFYRDYSNLQSGKLSGWKLHDAQTFTQLVTCYDLIYNSGCLSDADKVLIENGAFREAVRLFTATSPAGCCINDGPYAMTCGALLGAILGDHEAVKWAVSPPDGFLGFIRKYFLRDGHWEDGTFSYEQMSLGPLYGCPEVLQGYSDPPEYTAADRYDKLDLLSDPILRKIYLAPLRVLMPDGTGIPFSDSASGARPNKQHAETNYFWYPTPENRRVLAWVYEGKYSEAGGEYALFRRDPEADLSKEVPLDLSAESTVRPGVGWALLRTGTGKDAAGLYFKSGVYGSGHGHDDKLNIIYYDNGAELISDQGYLGARHEFTTWNHSTLSHNLVLVDGQAQRRTSAELLSFSSGEVFQTALGESKTVYPDATRYERSVSLVDHGPGKRYVVDVFRVTGGKTHDFVIHGAGKDFVAPQGDWKPFEGAVATDTAGAKWLRSQQIAASDADAVAQWSEAGKGVTVHVLGQAGTKLLHLTAPGLRNRSNPWENRDLHLLVARREGPSNTFVSVISADGSAKPLTVSSASAQAEKGEVAGVRVQGEGFDDLIVVGDFESAQGTTTCGPLTFRGRVAFLSRGAAESTACLVDGSAIDAGGMKGTSQPPVTGKVVSVDQEHFSVVLDTERLPEGDGARGRQLFLRGAPDGAYEIDSVKNVGNGRCTVLLADQPLLNIKPGQSFFFGSRCLVRAAAQ
jgi:hypothetical protein